MGVRTKRGPISIKDMVGGPSGCSGSFSIIYQCTTRLAVERLGKTLIGATDLEVPEPDLAVKDGKAENVVDERLRTSCTGRHAKYLSRYHAVED